MHGRYPVAMSPHESMAERREQELHNLLHFLRDAREHGAHVFTPQELNPQAANEVPENVVRTRARPHRETPTAPAQGEVDLNTVQLSDVRGLVPHLNFQEVLYSYQGAHYQCIIVGGSMYHHRLIEGVHGTRPFRREAPTVAPWRTPASQRPLPA